MIADVSGKGTPASLMMASVHAWLQAMAGTARPTQVLERLNRFLYANTQTSRYVTLFYGELDPARRRLAYVNAGHVPPYLRRRDGREERLTAGGPVLGLLEDVALEAGELGPRAGRPPRGGDRRRHGGPEPRRGRVRRRAGAPGPAPVGRRRGRPAPSRPSSRRWTPGPGAAGCTDDLTALILRAT